jgi:hypothetical protein
MEGRDWVAWHADYDDPSSSLSRRLRTVQQHLADAVAACPPGPISLVSMCAGEGRDVLGVLATHPRALDVRARLVELDPRNVAAASAAAPPGVEVVQADAALTNVYEGAVPCDILLVCGVFGNITDADVEATITNLPMFCRHGARVVWTRHRRYPDLTPSILRWFAQAGFAAVTYDAPEDAFYGVGVHRLEREPASFDPDRRLFTFTR